METCVLIPKEFSLANRAVRIDRNRTPSGDNDIWVVANCTIPQGTRIYPFQGTVRIDRLDVFSYINPSDIRHRFGLYDELLSPIGTCKVRYCNWIRFLRYANQYTPEVNIVASKMKGEPIYEVVRPIAPDKELVAYFLPDSPEDEFLLPAVHYLRYSLYRRTMATVMEAAPLDLSMSLVSRRNTPMSPSSDMDEMKSISSDTGSSSGGDLENLTSRVSRKLREKHLLPCEVCGKGFDRPSLLKRHMRTHTGEKPHVCDVCGKGFSTSSSLNTHRRIHSGEKPHQCGVCGKRFTASSNLYYHRMTHIKEKPHKCHLCSKSFPTPGDLKSHMYVHNGSWPYKCHICNRGFSKHTNLKNHLFLHTGDKPHVCELCKKRFALACNLRAHLKTHEGEQPETCIQCGNSCHLLEAGGMCKECFSSKNGLIMGKDTKLKLTHSIENLVMKDRKADEDVPL